MTPNPSQVPSPIVASCVFPLSTDYSILHSLPTNSTLILPRNANTRGMNTPCAYDSLLKRRNAALPSYKPEAEGLVHFVAFECLARDFLSIDNKSRATGAKPRTVRQSTLYYKVPMYSFVLLLSEMSGMICYLQEPPPKLN